MVGCNKAEIIKVIRTVTTVGDGTPSDPARRVTQLWSLDGELLCTLDPNENETVCAVAHMPL